jgi:hypothetical protein
VKKRTTESFEMLKNMYGEERFSRTSVFEWLEKLKKKKKKGKSCYMTRMEWPSFNFLKKKIDKNHSKVFGRR